MKIISNAREFGSSLTDFGYSFSVCKREEALMTEKRLCAFRISAKRIPKRVQERKKIGQSHCEWHLLAGVGLSLLPRRRGHGSQVLLQHSK